MRVLYSFFIYLYSLGVVLASPFNGKARLLNAGRRQGYGHREDLRGSRPLWFHAASLGEFEQGRPLIEALRSRYPGKKIIVTFFSPSGYEVRKDYEPADGVFYLPADTPWQARRFVEFFRPEAAFFIKYEYWYNFIRELHRREVPLFLVSAIFRPGQIFFKPYGGWFRRQLRQVSRFYCQDEESVALLQSIGIKRVTLSGDTRFDRVAAAASHSKEVKEAALFASGHTVIVAGSTWPADEALLLQYLQNSGDKNLRLIIAPHLVEPGNTGRLKKLMKAFRPLLLSEFTPESLLPENRVLIVDGIGFLIHLYKYGRWAYIGGGFGAGIHNTLEAAVFGKPVVFGPGYSKFREATELIAQGGGFSVGNAEELKRVADMLLNEEAAYQRAARAAGDYVASRTGAVELILKELELK